MSRRSENGPGPAGPEPGSVGLDRGSRSEKNSTPCRSAFRPRFGASAATAAAGALAGRALLARRAVGADAGAIGVTDVAAGEGLVALAGIALDPGSAVRAERTGILQPGALRIG